MSRRSRRDEDRDARSPDPLRRRGDDEGDVDWGPEVDDGTADRYRRALEVDDYDWDDDADQPAAGDFFAAASRVDASGGADGDHEDLWAPERSRRRRRTLVLLLLLAGLPLTLLGVAAGWVWWQLDPPGAPGGEVTVTVEPGWSVSDIADELDRRGVVGSSLVFQLYAGISGSDTFQAGRYELRSNLGVRAAVSALEDGPELVLERLAVRPGIWLTEVADAVGEQLPERDRERFLAHARGGEIRSRFQPDGVDTLEGVVFPDTYLVGETDDERRVAELLVARFDEVATDLGLDDLDPAGLVGPEVPLRPYDVIVVASLIQAEARVEEERSLIASVVYNRLRDGMPLQIDATVLYAIGERRPSNTAEDRATESPHNTYRVEGLPPTPIATVTEASLRAALAPAETEYRFYVLADEAGRHAFAETFEEHQANVAAARERGLLG